MHFTTLVLTDEPTVAAIESVMAPYQEGDCCPEEYLEFTDETESIMKDYDTYRIKAFFNGKKYVTVWDCDDGCEELKKKAESLNATIEEKLAKELYDFDSFCQIQCWDCKENNGEKRYGYYGNPNTEWDYWSLLAPEERDVFLKSEKPFNFPVKADKLILSIDDIPELLRAKYTRIWEQVMEDAPLENGEPEVDKYDYPHLRYCKTKREFLEKSTMGAIHNVYSLVSENGWISEINTEEIIEILHDNLDKYVSLVDCHI